MIRKLRRKFVVTNMLLVTIVLLAVLSALCLSSFRRFETDSRRAMELALQMEDHPRPPEMKFQQKEEAQPEELVTTFLVLLDGEGEISSIQKNTSAQIDGDFAERAVESALSSTKETGRIPDLSLRFLKGSKEGGQAFAFADTSREDSAMSNLLLSSVLILFGALTAFFLISLFLSRLALKPVKQAWEQQNQFLADASHELKTPLTVILANLKLVSSHREETIASQFQWIENTRTETLRMGELVEQLLFLARSESGSLPCEKAPVDFSDLVLGCLLPMESLAFEQGVQIREEIAPHLSVLGNEGQLRQLLVILLDNALKYAEKEKQVTISLSSAHEKLLLSVKNTGFPIPGEELPHLFERFYRSDKSRVRKKGGYGLGLSIAQTIVKSHAGRITAESSREAGTIFRVALPLYYAASKNT